VSITTTDCTKIFDNLLPTPGEANHFFGVLRTSFSWCETRNYLPDSPLRKLAKPSKTRSRKRMLSPTEAAAVWRTATYLNHPYGHLIKLLLWIGQRRGEIAAFRRSFINVVEKTATLPSSLPKNGHEHVFVLCEEALAYLNALPGSTDPFFPAKHASDERMNGWGKWKIAFDKRCPTAPWCLHNLSLRRTFATTFPADPGDPTPYHHQSGHISAHRRAAPACSSLGCE
jgi:integrase